MKRTVWLISSLPLVITAVALQFMPDTVPLHYNAAGEIDRWGSKYESLLFPAIALAMALVWQFAIPYFEKANSINPNDVYTMQALKECYYKLRQTHPEYNDKYNDIKAKLDAADQK